MIVKFYVNGSWHYFSDVDHFHYRMVKNGGFDPRPEGIIDFTEECSVGTESQVEMGFLNKNQTEETVVAAYQPIYLMNDNGKTVEII